MLFQLQLAFRELWFRKAKTVLTVVGIGVIVAMTTLALAFSNTLLAERAKLLNPLNKLGVDLVVAKKSENKTVPVESGKVIAYADLPVGAKFVEDNLSADAMPQITGDEIARLAREPGVAEVTQVLMVTNDRLEGTVPEDVEIPEYRSQPLSPEERQKIAVDLEADKTYQDLTQKIMALVSAPPESRSANGSADIAAMEAQRSAIEQSHWPERLKTIPKREIKVKEVPLTSKKWSLGSVDPIKPENGLITRKDIIKGRYFAADDAKSLIADADFAKKESLGVGGEVSIKNEKYVLIGIARPHVGGGSADLYLPLNDLRAIAGVTGANLLMVKAASRQGADILEAKIARLVPKAIVTGDSELRRQISGTLVSAAAVAERLTFLITGLIFLASVVFFTLIGLTTLLSRAPEIGTLKAVGWGTPRLIFQFFVETTIQAISGLFLGVLMIEGANRYLGPITRIKLSALTPNIGVMNPAAAPGALKTISKLIPVEAQLDWAIIGKIGLVAMAVVCLSSLFVGGRLAGLKPTAALKRLD